MIFVLSVIGYMSLGVLVAAAVIWPLADLWRYRREDDHNTGSAR